MLVHPRSAEVNAELQKLGLSITAEFVPYSKSRNRYSTLSLNWDVKVFYKDRQIIELPYSKGVASCAAYRAPVKELGGQHCLMRDFAIRRECETGLVWKYVPHVEGGISSTTKHELDAADAFYNLKCEYEALEYDGFEDWADNTGYSRDSISAKSIYDACLRTALPLRNALKDEGIKQLKELYENY